MLWTVFNRDTVLELLQLLVQFSDGIQELAIGLFGCLGRIEASINFALDHGEPTKQPEKIESTFPIQQRDVTDVVGWVLARELHVHIVVILNRWPARAKTETAT